jgi:hypothetical protein
MANNKIADTGNPSVPPGVNGQSSSTDPDILYLQSTAKQWKQSQ